MTICKLCHTKRASYGVIGDPRKWCKSCSVIEYGRLKIPVDQRTNCQKNCDLCKVKRASYGTVTAPIKWCSGCAKQQYKKLGIPVDQRIDKHAKCQICNIKTPNYGTVSDPRKWCCDCAQEQYMKLEIPLDQQANAFRKCEICNIKQPNYGVIGQPSRWCLGCSATAYEKLNIPADQRANNIKKCALCQNKQPRYGTIDDPYKWCYSCSEKMYQELQIPVDQRSNIQLKCELCQVKCPTFGTVDDPRKWCAECAKIKYQELKIPIDQRTKTQVQCELCQSKRPTFGVVGQPPRWCLQCSQLEYERLKIPHSDRKSANDRRLCPNCNAVTVDPPHLFCFACRHNGMPLHSKEFRTVTALVEAFGDVHSSYDCRTGCTNKRVDVIYRLPGPTRSLALEIDENQHQDRDPLCEIARMDEIAAGLGEPTLFIRFNPDVFTDANGVQQNPAFASRIQQLVALMENAMQTPDLWESWIGHAPWAVLYLFYDADHSPPNLAQHHELYVPQISSGGPTVDTDSPIDSDTDTEVSPNEQIMVPQLS